MELRNTFKENLLNKQKMLGGWFMSGNPTVAELMGCVGYDYVVIDMEHGTDNHPLPTLLRAIEQNAGHANGQSATVPVVRMMSHDTLEIKKALDAGANTLYFPFVQNGEQAQKIVSSALYPPKGKRGFAKMHRGSRYGTIEDYFHKITETMVLIAQIETMSAIKQIEDIAKVDGIDALFLGPGDLSVDLGLAGNAMHPTVKNEMEQLAAKAKELQIPIGTVVPTIEDVRWAYKIGYQFVSIGSDLAVLKNTMAQQIKEARLKVE